ncbi:TIGR03086 family metal-binding protein [soil metagenome]
MTQSILARGLDQLHGLLVAVTPQDTSRATPCAEWSVADLSDHVVNSTVGMATMARGGQPDWASSPHHDDPATAFREAGDTLLEAAAASDSAFPEGLAAAELSVHAYDLATALGRSTADLDPEIAEAGHSFMSASMTDDKRGDAFGPEQPAPEGSDAYRRIAAFAGRTV